MRLVPPGGEGEGGVGPAVGIEDPPGDSLHVTGDGVYHQLYGGDQEAAGQEQSRGQLPMIVRLLFHVFSYLILPCNGDGK